MLASPEKKRITYEQQAPKKKPLILDDLINSKPATSKRSAMQVSKIEHESYSIKGKLKRNNS
jgi:hypothetical protein